MTARYASSGCPVAVCPTCRALVETREVGSDRSGRYVLVLVDHFPVEKRDRDGYAVSWGGMPCNGGATLL